MDDGNAGVPEFVGQPHAESGGIDRYDHIGLEFARQCGRLLEALYEARQMRQHLGKPHDRKLAHGKQAFEALRLTLRPANAGKADAAPGLRFDRSHEGPGEVVAGGFARDDKD